MTSIRAALLSVALMLACLGFWSGLALADGGAASAPASVITSLTLPDGWAGLVLILLVGASWGLRKLTAKSTGKFAAFIHSTWGAGICGVLSAVLPAVTQAVQSHGLDVKALQTAIAGALLSYWASDNASNTSTEQRAKVLAMRASGVSGPGPTITKAGSLLPLAFSLALLSAWATLPGCAHASAATKAYGDAFAACMEAKGLSAATAVGTEAWNDLTQGTDQAAIEQQLEGLAGRAGVDAVTCAVQAWLGPPTPGAASAPKNPAGVAAAQGFLQRHRPVQTTPPQPTTTVTPPG